MTGVDHLQVPEKPGHAMRIDPPQIRLDQHFGHQGRVRITKSRRQQHGLNQFA